MSIVSASSWEQYFRSLSDDFFEPGGSINVVVPLGAEIKEEKGIRYNSDFAASTEQRASQNVNLETIRIFCHISSYSTYSTPAPQIPES